MQIKYVLCLTNLSQTPYGLIRTTHKRIQLKHIPK